MVFKRMKAVLLVLVCFVLSMSLLAGCGQTIQTVDGRTVTIEKPKYVFYLIGDGLGASQRQIAEYYLQHMMGDNNATLTMNDMAVAGINTTYALDTLVTDSAAAGTALACGVKTNNGMIAQTADGKDVKTLVEAVEELGYATGVVTSTRITHATPAVFYAHNADRDDENGIATDLVNSGVDFIAGGGYRNFLPNTDESSKREDDKDLIADMSALGYKTFIGEDGAADLASYAPAAGDQVLALFSKSHMPYEVDRANSDTKLESLSDITQKGVDLLSKNKDGFFLMVEGGRIDHACHPNDVVATIYDTLEFDEVVKVAMDFYNAHPKETLVVVVGDHETGGLGLGFANDYFLNLDAIDGITASFEDVYGNVYEAGGDRNAYYDYLATVGIKDFTDEEKALIEAGMDAVDAGADTADYGSYNPAGIAVDHIVSQRAGVQWTTYAHTGTQIPFSVMGLTEEAFGGFMDNTEIAQMVAKVLGATIGA